MKIFVATPVYDGHAPAQLVKCLLDEQAVASGCGDELRQMFLPNCSHAAMGRNQLAKDFLDSDCDKLVFLDSDITFDPGAIVKLAHKPVDFVGGAFRFKFKNENYPIGWLEDRPFLQADANGLLEVGTLPGGFMAISRKVFDVLKAAHPDRSYVHFGHDYHCYFQMKFADGAVYGEDSGFCKEWRDTGGKIYLDPEIPLTHWDFAPTPYVGHVGNWLKGRNQNVEPSKLHAKESGAGETLRLPGLPEMAVSRGGEVQSCAIS